MFFLQTTASWFSGIEPIDRKLFFLVNNRMANDFFDGLMPLLRESGLWMPLYLFMLVFMLVNFGNRAWLWILFAACTAAACDLVSSRLIKDHIFRLRPCNNPDLAAYIRVLVNYRPQSSSFTSSHATNHFGMAMFFVTTLKAYTSKWVLLFFAWAAIICFAQVYVGVHYPFDVVSGGLLGCGLGYIFAIIFNNYGGLVSLQNKSA